MLRAEGCSEDVEVSALLTDDRRMQELNRTYRDLDRPTDVLSFSQIEGEGEEAAKDLLGDVAISVETAVRQAMERDKNPDDEMDLLIAHGLLHLLGYEDETDAGADEMRRKAAAVLGDEIAR
ncbi:MAG: rRNA maturation RNase YbeY [Armatimonadota bacterium]|nr:rRNA maturation RNase YbeY [Armatimonadota bacterium]